MCDITARVILLIANSLAVVGLAGFLNWRLERLKTDLGVGSHVKKSRYDKMEEVADPCVFRARTAYGAVKGFVSLVKLKREWDVHDLDEYETLSDEAVRWFAIFMEGKGRRLFRPTRGKAVKFQADLESLHVAASDSRNTPDAREYLKAQEDLIEPSLGKQWEALNQSIDDDLEKGP